MIQIFLLSVLFLSCQDGISQRTGQALGTVINIKIYQRFKEDELDRLFSEIDEYEQRLSRNVANSEVNQLNSNAGRQFPVSEVLVDMAETALWAAEVSGGAFDPTIGPLVDLWAIGTEHVHVPPAKKLANARNRVDYRAVRLYPEKRMIMTDPDTVLEFGGIAKGYICDRLVESCREMELESVLLNLGGNVYALGRKPDGSLFRVGVQDPYSTRGGLIGYVEVEDTAIVTSGIYERFFEQDGVRYHHLLDSETGYPADNGLAGVTILCPSSTRADALSTALFVMGLDDGLFLAEQLADVEALFVTEDRSVYMTPGMADLFVLTSDGYTVKR